MTKYFLVGVLAFSAIAHAGHVRRITGKTTTPLISESLKPADDMAVEFVLDFWEGESESVLIAAGIKMSAHTRPGHSRSEAYSSFRALSTDDLLRYSSLQKDLVIDFKRRDSESAHHVSVVYLAEYENIVIHFDEFTRAVQFSNTEFKVEAIAEQSYSPLRLAGTPQAFEEGNLPVPFTTFFQNRNTAFNFERAVEPVASKPVLITPPVAKKKTDEPKKEPKKTVEERPWVPSGPYDDSYGSYGDFFRPENDYGGYSGGYGRSSTYKYTPPKPKKFLLEGFDKKLDELLALDTKPTIADMMSFMASVVRKDPEYDLKKNPFREFEGYKDDVSKSMKDMDAVREKLEIAFPGAIWYILGRDAYLYGDALEASYLAQGITGRVVRLPASAPSFTDASLEMVDGFLKTFGIDVDNVGPESVPRIILDISSYSASDWRLSQSRHLLRAAYDRWISLGRDPKQLAGKVNFVNVSDMHVKNSYKTAKDVEEFLSLLDYGPEPSAVLSAVGPGRFLYTTAWHGLYRPFQKLKDGSVIAPHDSASERSTKMEMLGELWEVVSFYDAKKMIKTGRALKCSTTMANGKAKK